MLNPSLRKLLYYNFEQGLANQKQWAHSHLHAVALCAFRHAMSLPGHMGTKSDKGRLRVYLAHYYNPKAALDLILFFQSYRNPCHVVFQAYLRSSNK